MDARPDAPLRSARGDRLRWLGLLGVAGAVALGLLLRTRPFVRGPGLWATPIDADNGVYYGAAALVWQGVSPYSDFTFLHPMMIAYLHAPAGLLSHLSVDAGFVAARWTAVLLGVATMALVATVLWRRVGRVAAVAGVAIYAVYPEMVNSDRGPFLEPVQNLLGVLLLLVWTSPPTADPAPRWWRTLRWRMIVSGVLLGFLMATKYTSGVFLIALIVSLPGDDLRSQVRRGLEVAATACVTFLVLMGPWLVRSPGEVWSQTVSAHLGRGDGFIVGVGDRVVSFFDLQGGPERLRSPVAWAVLAGACIVAVLFALRGSRLGRFVGALFLAEVALLLMVGQYWPQYNAILALPLALMAGWVAERCWGWLRPRDPALAGAGGPNDDSRLEPPRPLAPLRTRSSGGARALQVVGAAGLAVVALSVLVCARTAWMGSQLRSELIPELRVAAAELPEGCVVGLPNKTLLAVEQVAPEVDGRYLLDPYGVSLVETEHTGPALSPLPPSTLAGLEACDSVLADPDWVDVLGPTIEALGYVPLAELPVEGRLAVVYVRP